MALCTRKAESGFKRKGYKEGTIAESGRGVADARERVDRETLSQHLASNVPSGARARPS